MEGGGPDVIVVGDLMVDVSVAARALVTGGDVPGEVRIRPGGSGANAAVWAAAAGAHTHVYGRVGADLAGRLLRDTVDAEARTGTLLVVRQDGERSMVADRGANGHLSPADLPARLRARAVLVSGYAFFDPGSEPAGVAALTRAEAPVVAVDPASWPLVEAYGSDRFLAATQGANLILANAREAETLTRLPVLEAASELAKRYGRACVKLGPEGAVLVQGGRMFSARAGVVEAEDTTGAGDAFDGALLAALARGAGPEGALEEACRAGSRAASSADNWPG
ncbi:MAG: carbohydrate kinase family protein [Actinobacteria bacterium]|nr:MAG: carbohydrate kinase family protein [Actinomycetota bacterium]